jgi:diguanylate cyclase (GGDEF)-like protein
VHLEIDHYPEWIERHNTEDRDRVLAALGPALTSTVRQSDLVSRTGPARFSLLLLDCNLAGGRLVVDRIDGLLDPLRQRWGLGFSMGVATFQRDMTEPLDLAAEAEGALKTAQARGENQIEFFG